MKKSFVVLLVLSLFSFSIFCQDYVENQDKEESGIAEKVIKVGDEEEQAPQTFDSKVFDIHYEIKENPEDSSYILCLKDDSKDNYQMRVYVDEKTDLYSWYFDIEATLFDMFLDAKGDNEVINLIKDNPLFFTIVAYYNHNNDFVEDKETSSVYYMIDDRD